MERDERKGRCSRLDPPPRALLRRLGVVLPLLDADCFEDDDTPPAPCRLPDEFALRYSFRMQQFMFSSHCVRCSRISRQWSPFSTLAFRFFFFDDLGSSRLLEFLSWLQRSHGFWQWFFNQRAVLVRLLGSLPQAAVQLLSGLA